jgi:glycosyltransferase involved in cell wall biosynthesis
MTTRLCLNMIVKDEELILERALRAAAPHLSCYVIADTGSTDSTVAIIESVMAEYGVPGTVVHTTFRNFEQARNEALDAARASDMAYDYVLFCDADMELVVEPGAFEETLDAEVYMLTQRNPSSELGYDNVRLLRRDVPGWYVGVTHEYLDAGKRPHPLFAGAHFIDHAAGSSRTVKYQRDINLLTQALRDDPENSRYLFYLAQSYRDAGDEAGAIKTYHRRVEMGGWDEEVWYSLLQIAVLSERLQRDYAIVLESYLKAYQFRPRRAEPLMHLARLHRDRGDWALAELFGAKAVAIPRPADILFVDESTYNWRSQDEYSIALYWNGDHRRSMQVCRDLLGSGKVPSEQLRRIVDNLNFNLQKLGLPAEVV